MDERELCKRCGCCGVEWIKCDYCDDYGMSSHDCGECSCCCQSPELNVPCEMCEEGYYPICYGHCDEEGNHPPDPEKPGDQRYFLIPQPRFAEDRAAAQYAHLVDGEVAARVYLYDELDLDWVGSGHWVMSIRSGDGVELQRYMLPDSLTWEEIANAALTGLRLISSSWEINSDLVKASLFPE